MTEGPLMQHFSGGKILPPGVPFPEGVRVGQLLFLSGVIGHLPGEMRLPSGGIVAEARQAVHNLHSVLQGQGMGLQHLVRCTVMLADMGDWDAFNDVWRQAFDGLPLPARSAFACQGLALGARVEIECIAVTSTV
jgi:reactive intermediate/imine deaminase